MDHVSADGRSRIMRGIRAKDTRPELAVRRFLHASGLRYRLHVRELPGCPDIVLPRRRTVVFVHGCFWHQHRDCDRAKVPSTNAEYWVPKFTRIRQRDEQNATLLSGAGWRVEVVWECEIDGERLSELVSRIGTASDGPLRDNRDDAGHRSDVRLLERAH